MNKFLVLAISFAAVVRQADPRVDTDFNESGRVLVFWNGGTIKFVVGWTIPVPNHTPFVTLFTHALQMAYPAISNATQLHDFLQQGLNEGVRYTKRGVYFLLDRFFSRYGNLNRQCLTRFICELSQISVGHQFTADILAYLFKPEEKGKYEKAWNRGRRSDDCEAFYHCQVVQDMLSHFTTVQYL